MVKHIVAWKLKDNAEGNSKEQNALIMKEKLEALNGKIPGLLWLEVGIDFSKTDMSSDIVLYSEFKTRKDLDNYQVHPKHKEIVSFVVNIVSERRMVDYED